ncbi:MAG: hypothetical protein VYB40_02070 [Candidatus Thermoplasmatota archaeon]|mgnify:FL=1|nr:hypothetical protein [Candidatus Thermoplasmatota archaeon]
MDDLEGSYPVRIPVWWGRRGVPGPHPDVEGVSGKFIVIRHPKSFRKIESFLARILRAPKELRRPLDDLNSVLWELCDGKRTFEEICDLMDCTFHERIAPVRERTSSAIVRFNQLGLIGLSKRPFDDEWDIGPGIDPTGELGTPDTKLELEW